jgi:hypothetical protein
MKTKKIIAIILLSLVSFHFCKAQDSAEAKLKKYVAPWFVEKFRVSAGFFAPINVAKVEVGLTDGGSGTVINLKNDLGFKRSAGTVFGDFQYRLKRRSRFDLSYYGINRKSSATLKKDINFADTTYHVNTSVDAFFNSSIYRFSYGYAILEKPRYEAGILIGAHVVHSNVGLNAMGSNNSISLNKDFGFTAPLPDLGIWGGYSFSSRFALTGEFDYLSLKIGDIDGRILGGSFACLYHATKKLDISVEYIGLNFNVDATKPRLEGKLIWGYNGPAVTATYSFGKKYWVHEN